MLNKTALIVDDDADLCESLADSLVMDGYVTLIAHNLREADEHLARDHVDVILLDYCLGPVCADDAIIGKLRAHAPVVVLTAWRGLPALSAPVLNKPMRLEELFAAARAATGASA